MRLRRMYPIVAFIVAGVFFAGNGFSQEAKKPEASTQEIMEAAWVKAAARGEQHKRLEAMAGTWEMKGKSWMDPSAEPMVWGGTASRKMILGGRFLHEEVASEMMGEVFTGLGLLGYSNLTGKYCYVWLDNMSTGIMVSEGTCDEKGAVYTFVGEYDDAMTGGKQKAKVVLTVVDPNTQLFEMYMIGPDGKEAKSMESTYTKK